MDAPPFAKIGKAFFLLYGQRRIFVPGTVRVRASGSGLWNEMYIRARDGAKCCKIITSKKAA
jgi:hypothetical protein